MCPPDEDKPEVLDRLKALHLAGKEPDALRAMLKSMHASEIAALILDCRDEDDRHLLLSHVPEELAGEVLLELPENLQEELLAELHPERIGTVLEHLDSDDAADLLQSVDDKVAKEVIQELDPEDRRGLEPLLAHDEESAGGLMQAELFKVRAGWSIERVLTTLRRWGRQIEKVYNVYVVDDEDVLVGVVPLYELLFADPAMGISELVDREFPRVHVGEDQEAVARMFEKYDALAIPVVDDHDRLIGRITADDILDVVQEEATEDMYRLARLHDEDDLAVPVGITAWRRGIWLFVNLLTAVLASWVISQFEVTIAKIVALAVLMPIVASMGGIAGTQTLTVIVRSIALGRVTLANASRALIKEVSVSLLTGMSFALIIGAFAAWWFPQLGMSLGLIIGAAMLINLCAAGLSGALIPITLQRLNIDPALASGTILTTVTDVVGFFSFLGLATIFLL
ncbi:MAG TPA: magnesium transporter [Mariprofundaceae bacterium]|nr:magnesium transporter [Mariprofundaceae bacterium]